MSETVLEDLPYDDLRDRAFAVAEERRDIGFFVDLMAHAPSMYAVEAEGGSLGDISASLAGTVAAAREAFGEESVGDLEPLFRARFATYIREHSPA